MVGQFNHDADRRSIRIRSVFNHQGFFDFSGCLGADAVDHVESATVDERFNRRVKKL